MESLEPLTEEELKMLAFEARAFRFPGVKEEQILRLFRVKAARYYQRLNALIDNPAALAHDPQLVKRLLRERHRRTTARAQRTFAA